LAKIIFTGHSLGAAMATIAIATYELERPEDGAYLFTFGSPRTGNPKLADWFQKTFADRAFRFVHNQDLVPKVPPANFGFKHIGAKYWCKGNSLDNLICSNDGFQLLEVSESAEFMEEMQAMVVLHVASLDAAEQENVDVEKILLQTFHSVRDSNSAQDFAKILHTMGAGSLEEGVAKASMALFDTAEAHDTADGSNNNDEESVHEHERGSLMETDEEATRKKRRNKFQQAGDKIKSAFKRAGAAIKKGVKNVGAAIKKGAVKLFNKYVGSAEDHEWYFGNLREWIKAYVPCKPQ